jgi:hypothetical protein
LLANPFLYFKKEDARVFDYTKHVNTIRKLSSFVKEMSMAPMFFHVPFSGITFPSVPSGQLEETIYAAVIHYCHLDRPELPIPSALIPICSEKPVEYVTSWSLLEKMEFMKRNGKRYTMETLHHLMRIVSEKNQVDIEFPVVFSDIDVFSEILEHFHTVNSSVIGEQLRNKLMATVETYQLHPKQMTPIESPALLELKNYLASSNNNMYRTLFDFIDVYSDITSKQYRELGEFMRNVCDWNSKRNPTAYYDDELFRASQYVKNMVYMFSKVYPTLLQGNEGFYSKVHKHWGLSKQHETILSNVFKKYFSGVEAFKMDPLLKYLLLEISSNISDIHLFLQHLPIQTDIIKVVEKDGKQENRAFHGLFDKETVFELMKYSLYSCLCEYIAATDDPDVLRTEIQEMKRGRRTENAEMTDAANLLQTIPEGAEEVEETEMMQEVQIQTGNKVELKKRLCSFLVTCLGVDQENKKITQLSYREVMSKVNRSKEREKRNIIENFGKLGGEERRVENMLKNFRIGKWNVGQQRGLIEYDKDTFDREIRERNALESGNELMDEEMGRDVAQLQEEEDANAEAEGDAEAYNISDLGENYMDGEYYPEDRDEDFMED